MKGVTSAVRLAMMVWPLYSEPPTPVQNEKTEEKKDERKDS